MRKSGGWCSIREVEVGGLQQGHPQIRSEVSEFEGSLNFREGEKGWEMNRRARYGNTHLYSQHGAFRRQRQKLYSRMLPEKEGMTTLSEEAYLRVS